MPDFKSEDDSKTNDEIANEGPYSRVGRTTGPESFDREPSRSSKDTPAFRQGLFGLMAAFNWNKGSFSEHPRDVALRKEALGLLGLPETLSTQFVNRDNLEQLVNDISSGETVGKSRRSTYNPAYERQQKIDVEYVKNLIRLSKTLHP